MAYCSSHYHRAWLVGFVNDNVVYSGSIEEVAHAFGMVVDQMRSKQLALAHKTAVVVVNNRIPSIYV